jgi:hypothetical protein
VRRDRKKVVRVLELRSHDPKSDMEWILIPALSKILFMDVVEMKRNIK